MTDTRTTAPSKTQQDSPAAAKATIRDRAADRIGDAREAASDVATRAADAIEANPLVALAGGIAAGLVAGALIPRSEREKAALQPVGRRLAEGATAAMAAAKATGKEHLTASVMSRDAAKEGARRVLDSALSAAKDASGKGGGAASGKGAPDAGSTEITSAPKGGHAASEATGAA